jgi:4,5-dihydroxyphthalate decarboxylase
MNIPLTIAAGAYDRTAALRDGRVRPEGLDITWLPLKVEEIFWRMMRHREFDVSELSFSGYVVRRARGLHDLTAIPVFLSRSFRHNIVYVSERSGITRPEELAGRRIGVPEYQMTAAVWVRAFLQDDYGVDPKGVEWHQGGLEKWGRKPFEPVEPDGVTIVPTPEGKTLGGMLVDGEIDALISPRVPSVHRPGTGVRRLFDDASAAARDYYARTQVFPVMHTVAIRTELVDAHPWLPYTLLNAFTAAKEHAIRDLEDTTAHHITLPFLHDHVDETRELMGRDFWAYGLEANRGTLETFLGAAHRQGLTDRVLRPEELFPESTWHTQPI